MFFDQPTPNAFLEAHERLAEIDTAPDEIALAAQRFSRQAFRTLLLATIEHARARRQ